jgi:O-acetyl-ADP-ribose deacetylase (regulator of RNase III)
MPQLSLKDYSSCISLKDDYVPSGLYLNRNEQIINDLIQTLLNEKHEPRNVDIPNDYLEKRRLLRGLMNVREPKPINREFLNKLDGLLQTELKGKGVIEVDQLKLVTELFPNPPFNQSNKFILWMGDITQLKADAIVNAANKYMLGCFQPSHACIDNAIHSAAGPKLREDCQTIMSIQNDLEMTGGSKITRGYNLPSRFVLHTVGPIVPKGTELLKEQKAELASCYISCLELANQIDEIKNVAFCAISTGVYGFPKAEAARIAVHTVNEWLNRNPNHFDKIIFNLFSIEDLKDYLIVFNPELKNSGRFE